jgi:WD40 repeat protein
VLLWKVATGALLQTLEGHTSLVTSVAFSPHGKLLPTLLVSDKWAVENRANILWLPSKYRTTVIAVWNRSLALAFHTVEGQKGVFCFYSTRNLQAGKPAC